MYSCLPRSSVGPECSVQNNLRAEKPGSFISEAVGCGAYGRCLLLCQLIWDCRAVPESWQRESHEPARLSQVSTQGTTGAGNPWCGHNSLAAQLLFAQALGLGCYRGVVLPGPQHCSSLSPEPPSPQCLVPTWVSTGVTAENQLCCYTSLLGERCGEKAVIAFNVTPVLSNLPDVRRLFALHNFIFIIRRQRHIS